MTMILHTCYNYVVLNKCSQNKVPCPVMSSRLVSSCVQIKTPKTGETNITRRKRGRATKQRKAKEILGEGCGGLDGGKCLENGTNSRRSADVRKIHQDSNVKKRISEIERSTIAERIKQSGGILSFMNASPVFCPGFQNGRVPSKRAHLVR